MVKAEVIGKIREGLTPQVNIVAFQDRGNEIRGLARYQIDGFGYPVIAEATFRANAEGKILDIKGLNF